MPRPLLSVLAGDLQAVTTFPISALGAIAPHEAKAAIAEWNMGSDTWEWEPAFFSIYGLKAEEITPSSQALLSLTHPNDVTMVKSLLPVVPRGKEFSLTHRVFRQDGFVRLINATSLIKTDSKGQPALLHGTVDVLSDWQLPLPSGNVSSATDGDLMLCLRAQMPEAMIEVFQRHRAHMIGLVRNLYSTVDAEDVIQDVFEELFRKPNGFDARRGSLATYLNMHARSRCLDLGRSQTKRRGRETASTRRDGGQPVEDEALLGLSDLSVREALAALPLRERAPIELAYLEGLTYRAVAEHLGIPEGTAKARIRTGLLRLRRSDMFQASTFGDSAV